MAFFFCGLKSRLLASTCDNDPSGLRPFNKKRQKTTHKGVGAVECRGEEVGLFLQRGRAVLMGEFTCA